MARLMELLVSNDATYYVLLQRTGYMGNASKAVQKLARDRPIVPIMKAEARFRRKRIHALYSEDLAKDLESFKVELLARAPESVLDIGCGMAGIDVLIADELKRVGSGAPHFTLFDRTQIDKTLFYGYKADAAYYSSLDMAEQLLSSNGIAADRISKVHASPGALDRSGGAPFDFVVSLLAWGFHFPLPVYLAEVQRNLADGAVLVVDVRRSTDGLKLLENAGASLTVVRNADSYQRVVARF